MIEFGVVLFGVLTGNIMMSIAWVLLSAYSYIPVDYEVKSAVALMVFCVGRSIIKAGSKSK